QGMRYDPAGNLFAAGDTELVKLDPSDNVTSLGTSTQLKGVEVLSTGAPIVAKSTSGGTILKYDGTSLVPLSASLSLDQPYGLARDGGTIYIAEKNKNRIQAASEAGVLQAVPPVDSLITQPVDILASGPDETYILNSTAVAKRSSTGSNQY